MSTASTGNDEILAMASRFDEFYRHYDRTAPWLAGELDKYAAQYIEQRRHSWAQRLREADFPVAFLGSFSAGKSTIINAVLGRDLLPENTGATTAVPTIIRRGEQDEAKIYYLSEASKNETRDLITEDIIAPLGVPFGWGSDERDALSKLSYEVEAKKAHGKFDTKALQYLTYFIANYADHLGKVKTARVEDIRSFVENNKDVIFIDRIEIFLKDIDIPEDVTLVDLPGLGVLNKRHDRITKEYVEQKAKAFVVCLKAMHLMEGQELQFLRGVYARDRSVLNRAFWVLNQWDRLSPVQREDQDAEFAARIASDFEISKGRDFRVSALNNLMRTLLAQGQEPSARMKGHFEKARHLGKPFDLNARQDVEQLKQMLADDADAAQFDAFRTALFGYLNTTARQEFLQSARGEFNEMMRYLENALDVLRRKNPDHPDAEQNFLVTHSSQELKRYTRALLAEIDGFIREVRTSDSLRGLWTEKQKQEVCKLIADDIQTIDRLDLLNGISAGEYITADFSRLPREVSTRLHVGETLCRKIMETIGSGFMVRLRRLSHDLRRIEEAYMPEDLAAELDDLLGERDVRSRVHGLADVLMEQYNYQVGAIGAQVLNPQRADRDDHQRLADALELYRDRLSDFVGTLEVDKYIFLCLKNHAEKLAVVLQATIENSSEKIGHRVSDHLRTSDAVRAKLGERQKIRAAIDAFDRFRSAAPSRAVPVSPADFGPPADPEQAAINGGGEEAREPVAAVA